MKKLALFILLVLMAFSTISCSKDSQREIKYHKYMGNSEMSITLTVQGDTILRFKKSTAAPIDCLSEDEAAELIKSDEKYKKELEEIEDLTYTNEITKYAQVYTWDMDISNSEHLDIFLKRKDLLGDWNKENLMSLENAQEFLEQKGYRLID